MIYFTIGHNPVVQPTPDFLNTIARRISEAYSMEYGRDTSGWMSGRAIVKQAKQMARDNNLSMDTRYSAARLAKAIPDSKETWQVVFYPEGLACRWVFEGQNRLIVARQDYRYLRRLGCSAFDAVIIMGSMLIATYAEWGGPVVYSPAVIAAYPGLMATFDQDGPTDEAEIDDLARTHLQAIMDDARSAEPFYSVVKGTACVPYILAFADLVNRYLALQPLRDGSDQVSRVDIIMKTVSFEMHNITEAAGVLCDRKEAVTPAPKLYYQFMFQADTFEWFGIDDDSRRYFIQKYFPGWYHSEGCLFQATGLVADDIDVQAMIETVLCFERHYTTVGRFKLPFPKDVPLLQAGYDGLKLSVTPTGVWWQALGPGDNFQPVAWWEPGIRLRRMRVCTEYYSEDLIDLFDLALACLWRDMNSQGDVVTVQPTGAKKRRPQKAKRNGTKAEPVRAFPRRHYQSGQVRQWSSAKERRRIRRAYQAGGRPRRLPKGLDGTANPEQLRLAEEHGVLVPAGYTYVRPHVRGGRGTADAEPVTIRARGLATLIAVGRKV